MDSLGSLTHGLRLVTEPYFCVEDHLLIAAAAK